MRGTYILVLRLTRNSSIKIGRLGKLRFCKGYYCYVGSALGKAVNLENRIMRHFSKKKKKRWHIDYLLAGPAVHVQCAVVFPSRKRLECSISRAMEKRAEHTISGFGSSDCKCKGHLHYFKTGKEVAKTVNAIDIG